MYKDRDINWNKNTWDGNYDWSLMGEEWSQAWGGSVAQWYGCILPRIQHFLPSKRLVEIAPGHGRWTKFLIHHAELYHGIDLSQQCVDFCRKTFSGVRSSRFSTNNGTDLTMVESGSCDFLFSFDSLVHAEMDIISAYIPEILRVLSPKGFAFIHHSNGLECVQEDAIRHNHALSVSGALVCSEIEKCGGHVVVQEYINWGAESLNNCFTLFANETSEVPPAIISDSSFNGNIDYIRNNIAPYSNFAKI